MTSKIRIVMRLANFLSMKAVVRRDTRKARDTRIRAQFWMM